MTRHLYLRAFVQVMDIEREIDLGQIEEVIEMAKDELELIDYYYGEFVDTDLCE